jgi:hypothetical protein
MGWADSLKWWDGSSWRSSIFKPTAAFIAVGTQSTVTTITSIPTSVNGSASFTISGTVKTTGGANVTNGSAQLQVSTNGGTTWGNSVIGAATITAGVFTFTGVTEAGTYQWRVAYTAGAGFTNSTSAAKTVTRKVLTTYTKTYSANGSASYTGSGTKRTVSECYQGFFSSNNGRQKSVITFPTTPATDLAGANSIQKVELYLNFQHWGPDNGGTACVRKHSATSVPASWPPSGLGTDDDQTAWSTKTGAKWCDLASISGITTLSNWTGGSIRGFALVAPSDATEYYGYCAGNGQTGEPQLRITYDKWV